MDQQANGIAIAGMIHFFLAYSKDDHREKQETHPLNMLIIEAKITSQIEQASKQASKQQAIIS